MPGLEVYWPSFDYLYAGKRRRINFFPGYLFVRPKSDDPERMIAVLCLEESLYIDSIMVECGHGKTPKLVTLPDSGVKAIKKKFVDQLHQGFPIGSMVRIIGGGLVGEEGVVVSVDLDIVSVHVSQGGFSRIEE